jgi:glycosyltransferase involved in cell wall biosynthesis
MNTPPKILISAYACSPKLGSEPGMGWNWVNQISEYYDIWVLTDEYYAAHCREYLEENCISKPKLHLVGIVRPGGRHRLYGYFWLHYLTQNLWQRKAFKVAKRLHSKENFDLIHQLNMIGYREPGYLWQLDGKRPYIWGPIGGHVQMPSTFLSFLNFKDRVVYGLRNVINFMQMRCSLRVRKAMRRADVLFAATRDDAKAIYRIHNRETTLLNETGTDVQMDRVPDDKFMDHNRPLELVWSGIFIGCKALPLGLNALARARQKSPDLRVRLTILGDGPCMPSWRNLAVSLGIDDLCAWVGWVAHDEAKARIQASDAMLFTSLKDAASTVVPEAIMYGVPVICHDACGFGDMVTDLCGIKIPLTDPETSINGFANAMLLLTQDRRRLAKLAEGALARAHELSWQNRVGVILAEYRRLLFNRAYTV